MWESLLSFLFRGKEIKSVSFLYPAGFWWSERSVLYPNTDLYNHGTLGGAFLSDPVEKGTPRAFR